MYDRLSDDSTIVLDDSNRRGEQKILELWSEEKYTLEFEILPIGNGIGITYKKII